MFLESKWSHSLNIRFLLKGLKPGIFKKKNLNFFFLGSIIGSWIIALFKTNLLIIPGIFILSGLKSVIFISCRTLMLFSVVDKFIRIIMKRVSWFNLYSVIWDWFVCFLHLSQKTSVCIIGSNKLWNGLEAIMLLRWRPIKLLTIVLYNSDRQSRARKSYIHRC